MWKWTGGIFRDYEGHLVMTHSLVLGQGTNN
ncbi:hypothetical protein RDI58_012996 [Solanum bulbocastanum]|uniref:Uncharacterized protein n=1 Tax=Solanum bulbocastanum TaxID=147425 RepID=A0AAN8TPV5_SOLBU